MLVTHPEQTRSVGPRKPVDPAWAWAPYQPDDREPWNLGRVAHLYRRAAFGADWRQLQRAVADGPQRTIDRLLRPDVDVESFNKTYDQYEAAAAADHSAETLRAWWLRRMIHTPHPLLEKMTLFWRNHFAISNARVGSARLMQQFVSRLRRHALGPFPPLLQAMVQDPAVLLGLDAGANRKAAPNHDFARALLETFTLGPGVARKTDIAETARALTGGFALRERFRYFPREHDAGVKRILGQAGNFKSGDVVRILVQHRATPRFLAGKLYRWLVCESEPPSDDLLAPLAELLARDDDISQLVETILRSNLFFSAAASRRRVKSPVDFALGIVRPLEGDVSTIQLGRDLAGLGQDLCGPPTIQGWAGGRRWIHAAALVDRCNLAAALLAGAGPYGGKLDPAAVADRNGFSGADSAARFLLDLFLGGDLEKHVRDSLLESYPPPAGRDGGVRSSWLRRFSRAAVTLPEFQLS